MVLCSRHGLVWKGGAHERRHRAYMRRLYAILGDARPRFYGPQTTLEDIERDMAARGYRTRFHPDYQPPPPWHKRGPFRLGWTAEGLTFPPDDTILDQDPTE